eukprot:6700370-Prymnesium_polylepis.1
MAAIGVPVGEPLRRKLRADDESCEWLAPQLKAAFDLDDAEAERATALVMGRPNFLKHTRMLRARRDMLEPFVKMCKKVAALFVEEDDVEQTALT